MDEPSDSRPKKWGDRLRRLRSMLRRTLPFIGGVAATFIALFLYNMAFPSRPPLTTRDVKNTINEVMASATPPPSFSSQVYQVIQPSLVLILTHSTSTIGQSDDSLGTGIIIDDAGDIMTCLHVIKDARDIQVIFADGTKSDAVPLSTQPDNDIAILHPIQLPSVVVPATLGNPNAMRIGDEAYVVGNPFGLYGSMSAGVISGFNRSFQQKGLDKELKGLIQFDTAANPGNSGGPLLNRYGQVVGIVDGIVNPTGQDVFIGIGFAVPITTTGGGMGSPPD